MRKLQVVLMVLLINLSLTLRMPVLSQGNDGDEVVLKREEFELLKRQAFITTSILQRIRDLEKLYKQTKSIVEGVSEAIKLIKKFINFDDLNLDFTFSDKEFEDSTGVVMSPGFVEIVARTYDPKISFDKLELSELDLDLYYNKTLFKIDHIEGNGIFGDEYKKISLSQETSAAKDRIKIPLSDVLTAQTTFKIYLSPINRDLAKVGDKTNLEAKYYKRPITVGKNDKVLPLIYEFTKDSEKYIQIKVI